MSITQETFIGPTVDLKTTGASAIFTPTGDFVITGITFVAVNVTGTVGSHSLSFGTNSPNFNDFVSGIQSKVNANSRYQYYSIGATVNNVISGGSPFEINVVMDDNISTTNQQRVDITGYYI